MNTFNYKKSVQALNYLAVLEGGAINYMKALKLIWLSDRFHLRNHGRTITGDKYYALKNGPVASFTKDIIINKHITKEQSAYSSIFVSVKGYSLSTNSQPNINVFSQKELEVINTVYDNYKSMSEFEISEFSHNFPEWKQYEEKIKKTRSSYVIDMNLFFENYKDKSNLFVNNNEELEEMKSYQKTFFPSFAVV